jgi:hypothetical protein
VEHRPGSSSERWPRVVAYVAWGLVAVRLVLFLVNASIGEWDRALRQLLHVALLVVIAVWAQNRSDKVA